MMREKGVKPLMKILINRWFNIEAAKNDLGYEPIYTPDEAWAKTKDWFENVWKPKYGK